MTPTRTLPGRYAFAKLSLNALEDRATPATSIYSALTQTLTITAAQGDQIAVASLPGEPAGYLKVTETQSAATVFASTAAGQAVRNLVVKFGSVDSGGFSMNAGASIGGNLTVNGAIATQTVDLAGTVGGNVTYKANVLAAFDDIDVESSSIVGGNMSLNLGGGQNTARIKGGTIGGNMSIAGGTGNDQIEFTESGDVTISRSATIQLGAGNNTVLGKGPLGIAFTVDVGGNFTYMGGSGNDTINLDGSGTALDVGIDARFTLGNNMTFDGNMAAFEALRAGRNISVVGGIGNDSVTVSGALVANGNVGVNLGAGDNVFDSNQQGMGANSVGGNFTYVGGANGDVVSLDAITIGRNMTVALGDSGGSTQSLSVGLKAPTGATIYGAAKATSGSGVDGILLRRLYVGSNLNVASGAGNDTVTLDDINVAGATLIDLGIGNDTLLCETLAGDSAGTLANMTTFGGKVTIKGGDGNDTLNLSNDGDATTLIKFGAKASFLGGLGSDTLQNAATNVFKVTGNFNDFDIVVGTAIV